MTGNPIVQMFRRALAKKGLLGDNGKLIRNRRSSKYAPGTKFVDILRGTAVRTNTMQSQGNQTATINTNNNQSMQTTQGRSTLG